MSERPPVHTITSEVIVKEVAPPVRFIAVMTCDCRADSVVGVPWITPE